MGKLPLTSPKVPRTGCRGGSGRRPCEISPLGSIQPEQLAGKSGNSETRASPQFFGAVFNLELENVPIQTFCYLPLPDAPSMGNLISKWIGGAFDNFHWLIQEMDVTQWAIVAVIFVITGFMALRTKL